MKLSKIIEELKLKVFCGEQLLEAEVTSAYVSDLLSDVMGNAKEGQIWITLQNHLNVIAIASLRDLGAVVFVKDISPDNEVLAKAKDEDLVLLGSSDQSFELAGKLYQLLNP